MADVELVDPPVEPEALPDLQKWASENDPKPEETGLYERLLGGYRFNTFNLSVDGTYRHSGVSNVGSLEELQAKARRFNNEIKAFTHGLPCHASSAIYVVMDETRMDLMKALISGPDDSPYAHGFYLFDIACPGNYPDNPPSVAIMTTGEGQVRFNPNLYNSGYVCLSIINTWDSMPEEMWNPQHSNLLQVLVSIQALVMDELIIQKEPYYESLSKDALENQAYSDIVRYNNVKWAMLDVLRRPPPEFESVVFRHFAMKKAEILKTVNAWVAAAETRESLDYYGVDCLVSEHNYPTCEIFMSKNGYLHNLREVVEELKGELSHLPEITGVEGVEALESEYLAAAAIRRAKQQEQREAEKAALQHAAEAQQGAQLADQALQEQADLAFIIPAQIAALVEDVQAELPDQLEKKLSLTPPEHPIEEAKEQQEVASPEFLFSSPKVQTKLDFLNSLLPNPEPALLEE